MSLECKICLENEKFEKVLDCNHSFCITCLGRIKKQDDRQDYEYIICPLCKTKTVLTYKETSLPSKFDDTLVLTCEFCEEDGPLRKYSWCEKCEETTCGDCALTKHRLHIDSCINWNKFRVVKSSAICLERFIAEEYEISVRKRIDKFCENLKTILNDQLLSDQYEAIIWRNNIADTFGDDVVNLNHENDIPIITKLVNTLSKIIQFKLSNGENETKYKEDAIKMLSRNYEKLLSNNSLKQIIAPFLEKAESSFADLRSVSNKLLWITSDKTKFSSVSSFCQIQNNLFLLLDGVTIYKLDKSFNVVSSNGLPPEEDCEDEIYKYGYVTKGSEDYSFLVTYDKNRKSVFITYKWNLLFEFNIEDLNLIRIVTLPTLHTTYADGLNAPRLIAILENEKVACISGDNEWSCIWIMFKKDIYYSRWKLVWSKTNTLEPFRAVHQTYYEVKPFKLF